GAVVQDTAIFRPRPGPLAIDRRAMQLPTLRAGAVHPLLRENAAVQPAPAGGRAIAGKLGRPAQLPPLAKMISVDLPEHLLGIGFALDSEIATVIVPSEVSQRRVTLEGRIVVERFEPLPQVVGEPGIGAAIAWRQYGSIMPLDHALGVGERAVLLDHRCSRQEEDLGRDGFRVR